MTFYLNLGEYLHILDRKCNNPDQFKDYQTELAKFREVGLPNTLQEEMDSLLKEFERVLEKYLDVNRSEQTEICSTYEYENLKRLVQAWQGGY